MRNTSNVSRLQHGDGRSGETPPNIPTSPERGSRRTGHSNNGYRSKRKIQRLQLTLAVLLSTLLLGAVVMGMFIQRLGYEQDQLLFKLHKREHELSVATTKIEQLRQERDGLVAKRIPNLKLIQYDQIIPVSEKYIRNISFTLTKSGDTNGYEYRIVLSNDGFSNILPNITMLLFDELGVQLGDAEITSVKLSGKMAAYELEPGEVRSYSDAIELKQDGKPKYFILQIG